MFALRRRRSKILLRGRAPLDGRKMGFLLGISIEEKAPKMGEFFFAEIQYFQTRETPKIDVFGENAKHLGQKM